jgi:hypothetical protein
MNLLVAVLGLLLLLLVLIDAFETVILPRRVAGRFRLTRVFYRLTWAPWAGVARRIRSKKQREGFLSVFGPLSLLGLLLVWALALILSFALMRWAGDSAADGAKHDFGSELYTSGIAFVTLQETPSHSPIVRTITVATAMMGFGFLALVISYLPVMYQSFSRREANITLLDARAGSPPSAFELLARYSQDGGMEFFPGLLQDWERWSAELLESHISYPMLAYFRSQHDNQSWLAALTTVLDASALAVVGIDGVPRFQAQMTFAMARHAIVDLAKIFDAPPCFPCADRLNPEETAHMRQSLAAVGLRLRDDEDADRALANLRRLYEPYVDGLSNHFLMELPPWTHGATSSHNWQTSKWEHGVGRDVPLH